MSRMIHIGFRPSETSESQDVEIQPPYYLLGSQASSKQFWSLPIWSQIGARSLAELGATDPVHFIGWESLEQLGQELELYRKHLLEIDYDPHLKATWLAHLTYCHALLSAAAPPSAIPEFSIG